MNMNLYGHNGQWIMVDCGVSFDEPITASSTQRFDVVCADPAFITRQKENLLALIITHAHEDHIGAVAHLWRRFQCPVYTTSFTAAFLQRKLAEKGLAQTVPVHIVDSHQILQMGGFEIKWLPLTHSLPEPHSLLISTSAGRVFHTGDWKIDSNPVIGKPFDNRPFKALAKQDVDALVCDSTNSNRPGRTLSEGTCYKGLLHHVKNTQGRVVVACFGSNVARLRTLMTVAQRTDRYVGLLGRSLKNMVATASNTGYWPEDAEIISPFNLGYLPAHEVMVIATGSQAEPRTALVRLANGNHPDLELEAGDTVIFSAIVIPGNEEEVAKLVAKLKQKNVNVVLASESEQPIHASGHPSSDDVKDLYHWVQPRIAIPVHGETEHMSANAELARGVGVPRQMLGQNGDLFVISEPSRVVREFTPAGRIVIEQ